MTVAVFGVMRFPPEAMDTVRPHLKALIGATREKDGCIAYDAAEDVLEPGLIRFSELWPDQATLDAHLLAPHIAPWRAACQEAGLMERQFAVYDVAGAREL